MAKKKKAKVPTLAKTQRKFASIMSFDMGVKNCAYAVLKNKKLMDLGFFQATISNLIDPYFNIDLDKFVVEFTGLLDKHKPDAIVAERFQNRGMFRGNGSELINIMIGLMARICHERKIYIMLIPAAQWKTQFNRNFEHMSRTILVKTKEKKQTALEVLYESLLPFPNHPIDAHLQGWYLANLLEKNQYTTWKAAPLKRLSKTWMKEHSNGSKAKRKKQGKR